MYAHTRWALASNVGAGMCSSVRKDKRLQYFRLRQKRIQRSLLVAEGAKAWRLQTFCAQFQILRVRATRLALRDTLYFVCELEVLHVCARVHSKRYGM